MEERIIAGTFLLLVALLLIMIFNFSPATLAIFWSFVITLAWLLSILYFIFERQPTLFPLEGEFIIAPADGRIMQISEEDGFDCIKIFMDIHNIHTQVVPYDGKVIDIKKIDGPNKRAYLAEAEHNKQVETTIETKLGTMKIKQLTGIMVRRIKTYPKIGQSLKRGEKFGRITFGSNVYLYLPKGKTRILVDINQDVKVGATKLAVPV